MRRSTAHSAFATFFRLAPLMVLPAVVGCSGAGSSGTGASKEDTAGNAADDTSGDDSSDHTSGGKTDSGKGPGSTPSSDDDDAGASGGTSDAGKKADAAPTKPSIPVADGDVWADGKQVTSSLIIQPGSTASIAPGATITIAAGVTITVAGTLKGSSTGGAHAKLTGAGWPGLVVQAGGTLTLDGVDVENAATGIQTSPGNGVATLSNGLVSGSKTPFDVGVGSSLTVNHSKVTASKGPSKVNGSFTASYMDYDGNGYYGIYVTDASATISVEDSKMYSQSRSVDLFEVSKVANFHVAHTAFTAGHCAFHFTGATNYDISYVDVTNVSFAFMMWGSDTSKGTRTVTNSNFTKLVESITGAAGGTGISEEATNGAISVTGSYFDSTAPIQLIDKSITVAKVQQPVAGVGPR